MENKYIHMELNDTTPQEWLKLNYNLQIGNRAITGRGTGVIVNILETDNIGCYRTKYPVVVVIDYLREEPQKETLESILGY